MLLAGVWLTQKKPPITTLLCVLRERVKKPTQAERKKRKVERVWVRCWHVLKKQSAVSVKSNQQRCPIVVLVVVVAFLSFLSVLITVCVCVFEMKKSDSCE